MVAHPDDETLWAGGTLLQHPAWQCRMLTLCRARDADRAPRFARVCSAYRAAGEMADLDDGPEQTPLDDRLVQQTVLDLLGNRHYDLLLTHGPLGEYTRHQRHVEVSRAVAALWQAGRIDVGALWLFAYTDDQRAGLPHAIDTAEVQMPLPEAVWEEKYHLIHDVYGFAAESWEARTTPRREAFWRFTAPAQLMHWHQSMEVQQ